MRTTDISPSQQTVAIPVAYSVSYKLHEIMRSRQQDLRHPCRLQGRSAVLLGPCRQRNQRTRTQQQAGESDGANSPSGAETQACKAWRPNPPSAAPAA
jgi:hypothetical protein